MPFFIFVDCPPEWAHELKRYGYNIATLKDCPNTEKFTRGTALAVVGDKWWANALETAYITPEELKEFLQWLRRYAHQKPTPQAHTLDKPTRKTIHN